MKKNKLTSDEILTSHEIFEKLNAIKESNEEKIKKVLEEINKYEKLISQHNELYEYVEKFRKILSSNITNKISANISDHNINDDNSITSIYGKIPHPYSDVDKLNFYDFILKDIAYNMDEVLNIKYLSLIKDYDTITKLNIDYTNFISDKISKIIENTNKFNTEQYKPLHRKKSYI
jgi:hypothetical protein